MQTEISQNTLRSSSPKDMEEGLQERVPRHQGVQTSARVCEINPALSHNTQLRGRIRACKLHRSHNHFKSQGRRPSCLREGESNATGGREEETLQTPGRTGEKRSLRPSLHITASVGGDSEVFRTF